MDSNKRTSGGRRLAALAVLTAAWAAAAPAADFSTWHRAMRIRFTGYTAQETLTNFPALVQFAEGANGFSHADVVSADAADLRFTDESRTKELNHEIESWNPGGVSHVWVQVPALSAGTAIWAFYGRPGQSPPVAPTAAHGRPVIRVSGTWPDHPPLTRRIPRLRGTPAYNPVRLAPPTACSARDAS